MGKIDDLIAELCPDGVEYRALGDVGTFTRGSGIQKKDFVEAGEPCIHYGQIYTRFGMTTDHALSFIPEAQYKRCKIALPNDVVIAITSENVEDVCTPLVWEGTTPVAVSGHACFFHSDVNPRYIAYCFGTEGFWKQKKKIARGAKVIEVKPTDLATIQIPVPPMEIQQEIVRILDSFAELETELETELEARRAQYAYYRDKLLDFTERESVSWLKLGDICLIQRGASPRPIRRYITDEFDGIPWIKIGDVDPNGKYIVRTKDKITEDGAHHSRFLKAGAFVLSNSMSFGRPYILRIDGCIHDGWLSLCDFENSYLPDFLFHLIRSSYVQQYWLGKVNTGSVSNLNADIVKETPVPVPPLSEQRHIVDILDRFEAFTTSLSDGLPAEIEARRQQYEHYRDKLLDFPRKVA